MRELKMLLPVVFVLSLCFGVSLGDLVVKDERSDCMSAVNRGHCRTEPEEMMKGCRKSCADYERNRSKFDYFLVDEDEESFFDLNAKTFTGKHLDFEQFDGYVTIVTTMAKLCKSSTRPDSEAYFATLEELQRIWPYSLELLVFPFEHPSVDYATEDCVDFEESAKKTGRPIHVMEMIDINAPFSTLHPVFKYFKTKAILGNLDVDTATCFLINPEGRRIEVHQSASLDTIKKHILGTFREYEL